MKKKYIEPTVELSFVLAIDVLTSSNDNWADDPRIDGWDDWD